MKKQTKTWIWIIFLVATLILGIIIGANLFPKMIYTSSVPAPTKTEMVNVQLNNAFPSQALYAKCFNVLKDRMNIGDSFICGAKNWYYNSATMQSTIDCECKIWDKSIRTPFNSKA